LSRTSWAISRAIWLKGLVCISRTRDQRGDRDIEQLLDSGRDAAGRVRVSRSPHQPLPAAVSTLTTSPFVKSDDRNAVDDFFVDVVQVAAERLGARVLMRIVLKSGSACRGEVVGDYGIDRRVTPGATTWRTSWCACQTQMPAWRISAISRPIKLNHGELRSMAITCRHFGREAARSSQVTTATRCGDYVVQLR